jgi:AcrR family transcriptional regulator
VASRAGVSKGGLLYNFPSKAKLLEALVEQHLSEFEAALLRKEQQCGGAPNSLAVAYIELFAAELEQCMPPPSGVLAAMVENPDFLAPVKRFNRVLLDRMKANARDETCALTVFLALEGMRSMRLFDVDVLSPTEKQAVIGALSTMLR